VTAALRIEVIQFHCLPMTEWVFRDDSYARRLDACVDGAEGHAVTLDRTIFYPQGGGQPGDTGMLVRADGTTVPVIDTHKGMFRDDVIHVIAPGVPLPEPGEVVQLVLDWERRHAHMRMHTACHLLCAALPFPVTGGSIRRDSARMDFDMPADAVDRQAIAAKLNAWIAAGQGVRSEWIEDAELDLREELVRTMAVAPPRGTGKVRLVRIGAIDLQACGGTHVADIAEIGPIVVEKIENKGRQNRRVTIAFAGD
jgi:misacylated tRNA(Ala) deacylase